MTSNAELCANCAKIPWDQLLQPLYSRQMEVFYHTKAGYSPCDICEALRKIAAEYGLIDNDIQLSTQGPGEFGLWSPNLGFFSRLLIESPESPTLGDLLHPNLGESLTFARAINIERVDWERVRCWIQMCRADSQHVQCRPPDTTVDNIRVIDCVSKTIVSLPQGCEYAALSYVWGPDVRSDQPSNVSALPHPVPKTIKDAMICVRQLGLRYLWVDRYCIDQTSPTKHLVIQNMDQIYGCASITIIDAAGSNSDCALPGVSDVSRCPQVSMNVRGRKLLSIRSPGEEIENSRWASRGWTFQEGYVSKRRLVITPSQVYFQCNVVYCCECVAGAFSLEKTPEDGFPLFEGAFTYHKAPSSINWEHTFENLLGQYFRRKLAFDSDTVLAFLAIIKSLAVNQFWGLPFRMDEKPSAEVALLRRLTWFPFFPSGETYLTLKEGFPTWSWAAWSGNWHFTDYNYFADSNILESEVTMETLDGQRCSLVEYCSFMDKRGDMNQFLPVLHIQGWIAMVRFSPKSVDGFSRWMEISDRDGLSLHLTAEKMEVNLPKEPDWMSSQSLTGTWPILVFWDGLYSHSDEIKLGGLILKPCENGSYQKLGNVFPGILQLEKKTEKELHCRCEYSGGILKCERRSIRLV